MSTLYLNGERVRLLGPPDADGTVAVESGDGRFAANTADITVEVTADDDPRLQRSV